MEDVITCYEEYLIDIKTLGFIQYPLNAILDALHRYLGVVFLSRLK